MPRERGKKRASDSPREIEPATGSRIRIALSAGVVASFLAAQAGPSNWLWGMNLLRYYPRPLAILWTVAALAAVWWLPERATRYGPQSSERPVHKRRAPLPPLALAVIASALAAAVFVAFRSRSVLLGDGMEILRRLHQGKVPAPRSPLYDIIEPMFFRAFSRGEVRLEAGAAGVLSIIAGVIAVGAGTYFLARMAARKRGGATVAGGSVAGGAAGGGDMVAAGGGNMVTAGGGNAANRGTAAATGSAAVAGVLLFLTGAIQLFFGYVEVYPLVAATTLIFYSAAFDYMTRGEWAAAWAATIALLIGLAAHPFAITLVPGWLYLISTRQQETGIAVDRRRVVIGVAGAVGAIALMAAVFAVWPALRQTGTAFRFVAPQELWHGISRAVTTIAQPRPWSERYGILSMVHLADCWNALWLVGACGICVIAGILAGREGRSAIQRPPVILALLCLIGVVFVRALFRTPLGAMRDWDLFSGLGIGVAGLAAALALTTSARFLVLPIGAAATFFVVPWIGIQTSTERAAARHIEAIEAEPRPEPWVAAYFHCAMGDRFANLSRYDLAASAYQRALEAYPRHEFAWRLGTVEMSSKHYALAAGAFERALEMRADDEPTSIVLAEALMAGGDIARAAAVLDRVLAADPASGMAHLRRGQIDIAQGRFTEAGAHLKTAEDLMRPDDTAARNELKLARMQFETAMPKGGAR